MAQAVELAQDHHPVENYTDVLVLWNVSCNMVRYVMESSEDLEMLYFQVTIRSELLQLKRCANYQEIIGQWFPCEPCQQ